MNAHYRALPFSPLDPESSCVTPDRGFDNLTLDHAALTVMTDFRLTPAATTEAQVSVSKALEKMKTVGVRMLLVTKPDGTVHGLITAHDILGERCIEYIETHRVKRDEVAVADIMQTVDMLRGLKLQDVLNASIGDLVHSLKGVGLQHVLVATVEYGEPKVRGIFSSAEIARQLGLELDPMGHARSFAELEKALLHTNAA